MSLSDLIEYREIQNEATRSSRFLSPHSARWYVISMVDVALGIDWVC